MKAKYIGKSFGVDGLTDNKIYEVIEVDEWTGALRLTDDGDEDYWYHPKPPKQNDAKEVYGYFKIVGEDERDL